MSESFEMLNHHVGPGGDHLNIIEDIKKELHEEYGPRLKILPTNDQVRELQTILRDSCTLIRRNTTRSDFKFYADRLIRLVIEESLNQLPFSEYIVTTPTGAKYNGLKYQRGNCGVSIVRSGEAMEQGLRDCCRSIRIGKILVESDAETHEARVVYARFPEDIASRKVLLMYPIMRILLTKTKCHFYDLFHHSILRNDIWLLVEEHVQNCFEDLFNNYQRTIKQFSLHPG